MVFSPRPNQAQVLAYRGGRMGVSAVPGSGKTTTLSMLAADLISGGYLEDDQEILIVTLVNSAVDNFSSRVSSFIRARGLLPNVGYRVRTLHGLAHDIVRERPDLAGVSENFEIADELTTERILRSVSDRWANANPDVIKRYLKTDLSESNRQRVLRRDWPNLVRTIADALIRQCKDYRISAADLENQLGSSGYQPPLLEMGMSIYAEYEKALTIRGLLDFNDLIVRALVSLETDGSYLQNLQDRWPFILEDEAQDSSRLQERILQTLVGGDGNWVRVGDPNQAIFETFTTASPEFLRAFLDQEGVLTETLPHSGRSTESIIDLANQLIRWTSSGHPVPSLRNALQKPYIRPTPPGDPQPNPPDQPGEIHLVDKAYTAEEEIMAVSRSVEHWIQANPDKTAAVLVPRNERGARLVEVFKTRSIPYIEILRSTEATRNIARLLAEILRHLASPNLPGSLAESFHVWCWAGQDQKPDSAAHSEALEALRRCSRTERYVWPKPGGEWLDQIRGDISPESRVLLAEFQPVLQRWHAAALLPIDQLLLSISQDLTLGPDDLALVYKLSLALARIKRSNPSWQILDMAEELERIASNQRRFIGFGDLDNAFDPDQYPGKVIVSTMHKAKGLEWDRVYLLAVNQYNFPSLDEGDAFISERWFLRDDLNLQAEALAQLRSAVLDKSSESFQEGEATLRARADYAAERLRLLFVGITRAKRELVITWNLGRRDNLAAARPLQMLIDHWGSKNG